MNEEATGDLVPMGVQALQRQAEDAREVCAVIERYGYVDTSYEQLLASVRQQVQRSVQDMLEIGRAVCCFRAMGRGHYGSAIRSIGLSPATAHRLAEVSMKFLGKDHLKPLLTLDRSKVYELALLDDSTLDEMADELADNPAAMDAVERMSVSELKRALREARNGMEAKDALIKSVQEDNGALREREINRGRYAPDQVAMDQARQRAARMQAVHTTAQKTLTAVSDFGITLRSAREEGDAEETAYATQTAQWLAQQLANLYVNLGIEVDFQEVITPSWTRQAPTTA